MPAKVRRLLAAYVLCGHGAVTRSSVLSVEAYLDVCIHGACVYAWLCRGAFPLLADVKVFVDPKAVMYLVGSVMDFVEDAVRAEFVFQNPNAKGACGCGESFNV